MTDREKLVKPRWTVTLSRFGQDTACYVGYGDTPEAAFSIARGQTSAERGELLRDMTATELSGLITSAMLQALTLHGEGARSSMRFVDAAIRARGDRDA